MKNKTQKRDLGMSKFLTITLMATTILTVYGSSKAQVVTAGTTNTQVYNSPNGVPVVDIANPNASGMSHNQFINYNVGTNGLVLNNGDSNQMARQSQLAGQVMANMNLTNQATLILNEVTAANRSTLAGYTEVLGGAADVIVANPYGITCSGCGFINTPNATLTTGTPQFNGSGNLVNLQVNGGDILVTGTGLNASNQNYLGLIGRAVKLEGQLNAKDVDIVAGTNDWNPNTKTATPRTPGGTAPTLAIDSSALGGMYADRIRLIATEAGVGVKMDGEAAAGVGDFTLTSSGKIELNNHISAQRDTKITSTASGNDAIKATNAKISAARDVQLTANSGQLKLRGGTITATRDLALSSGTVDDSKTTTSDTDNNKRYVGNNLSVHTTGDAVVNGTVYGAGAEFSTVIGDRLVVGADGVTIYGASGNIYAANELNFANGKLKFTNDATLKAEGGDLTVGSGGVVQSTAGNLTLIALNNLNNFSGGTITTDTGAITLRSANHITNVGAIYAKTNLNITNYLGTGTVTEDLTNSGTMIGDALVNASVTSITNSGTIQGGSGASNITATGTITNQSGGKIILSTAGGTGTITSDTLDNSGIVQSTGALAINTATEVVNRANAKIIGTGNVTLRGTDAAYTVNNSAIIQSGGTLDIKGQSAGNGVTINGVGASGSFIGSVIDFYSGALGLANGSGITSANNLTIDASSITLSGVNSFIVGSNGNHSSTATISASGTVSNYGFIYSGNSLSLSAVTINNQANAAIAAYGTGTLNASSSFSNSGDLYAATLNIGAQGNGGTFTNTSTGVVNGTNIDFNAASFYNYNDIMAGNNLTIEATTFRNSIVGGDTRTWNRTTKQNRVYNTGSWDFDPDWLPFNGDTSTYRSGSETWDYYQSYGTTPTTDMKARLIANGTLSIINFSTAINLGSIITAPTLYVNSNQGGATFTNDAYDIQKESYTNTWQDEAYICDVIYLCYTAQGTRNFSSSHTTATRTAFGANISFNSLTGSGFGLINQSALVTATVDDKDKTGASATTGTSAASFGGITVTVPTSPNGFFVVAQDPNSEYLIETNPKYGAGSPLGSKYMLERLGLDPAQQQKRLGDGNYEAQLVRDQLTAQIGNSVIIAGETEEAQMQRLMDNGVDKSKSMGLTYGKALTAEQVAVLDTDMVWMVETEVMGKKVLAPVVYLSSATKESIVSGAVIAGNNIDLNLNSMTNSGGTIIGKDTLAVTSKGDITNTSGTIKGGDVSLTSTEGSIINETYANTSGTEGNQQTTIGKTGSIESTGNLNLDAKKNIKNVGADMTAGGDASLKAGENITFDVIDDKKSSTTRSSSAGFMTNDSTETVTSSSHAIGSNLKVGGNLKSESGGDTTIRGSNVDVKGDGDMKAGGNFSVLDARDIDSSSTKSKTVGAGVGGGVYGAETSTDSNLSDKSHGSSLKFGGNAKIEAAKDLTIQGSDVETGGDLGLKGKDVKIVEGRDIETESHSKTTTTFGKIDGGTSENSSDSGSDSGTDGASASAGASAETGNESSGGVTLAETTTDTSGKYKDTSKSSNIKSGGNMKVEAENDALIRGSNVEAGGDVELSGKNVNIEAAKDVETSSSSHSKTQIGLYGDSSNKAGADASADASADAGGATAGAKGSGSGAGANYNAGDASAEANAHAGAEASTENTVDVMRTTTTTTDSKDVTHTGSSIKSGGNAKITAKENLNVKGSSLESGGDMDLSAKDMKFEASQDEHTSTTKTSTTRVGTYYDAGADASADANAGASAKDKDIGVSASAEANANAGVGFRGTNTTSTESEGSTKANTSSIKSGGNLTRNAENKITDEGTQIEAGGDFTQNSKEWDSKAAKDTSWSSSDSETNTAKFGLYGEANAGASAGASAQGGTENESGAGASAGVKASYNRDTESTADTESKAVVSNIKSGGNMKTTTTGKTSMEGINLESGGDMELNAGSLDYKAAKDTKSSSKSTDAINAELSVGIDATKAVTGTIAGGYEKGNESDSSTHEVAGSMKSGGNMKVNVKDDAKFVGTNIEAGGDASVKAGGDLKFDAARDTESHTDDSMNASGSLSASKSKGATGKGSAGMGLNLEGGMDNNKSSSSTGTAGSIKSGGNMDVSAGKSATFEGTNLESGGDMNVEAKDNVNFNAVKDTESSEGYGFSAQIDASKGGKNKDGTKNGNSMGLNAEGNYNKADSTTSTGSTLKSGGNLKVKSGGDTNLEGTSIESEKKTTIDAGKSVNFKAAEDTSSSIGVEAGLSMSKESAGKDKTGKADPAGGSKDAGVSLGVEGGKSNTKKAGSIKAGEIEVNAGKDANFEGTDLDSKGDASIKAGGDVNFNAAESSSIDGSFKGSAGSGGAKVTDAGIGGQNDKKGSNINTGGNLKVESGGNTKLEGTKANVEGSADIKAGGKIEKKTTVSGGGEIGMTRAGANIDVQQTEINAKGGVTEKKGH